MPFTLINEITRLMDLELSDQPKVKDPENTLIEKQIKDEDVLARVDRISNMAANFFGPKIQPTLRQCNIMAERGFPVIAGGKDVAGWTSGLIVTPKGSIRYR